MTANIALFLLAFLLLAGGIAAFVLTGIATAKANRHRGYDESWKPKKQPKWPALLIAAAIALVVAGNSFTVVPTGYTGVRTTFGLIDQESCMPGFNALTPFVQKVSLVNNKQQDIRINDRIWSETKEQVVVYMEGTVVTYQIVPASSAWIYANVENWVEELVDADIVSSAVKAASRTMGADEVTDRGAIEPLCVAALQKAMDAKYGPERVTIKNVIINNIDFEDSYNQAIAEKSNAMQDQQRQAITNQTAIDKAKADAEAERQRAQGEADAELIRAQAKADAAREIAKAVTEATQLQDAIDKWDGQLPLYVAGDGGTFGIMATVDGNGGGEP